MGISINTFRLSPQAEVQSLTIEGCLSFALSHEAFLRRTWSLAHLLPKPMTLRSSRGKSCLLPRSHHNNRKRCLPRTSSAELPVRSWLKVFWKCARTEGFCYIAELRHRQVRIYVPTRNTMQSGGARGEQWRIDFDILQGGGRWENQLMGWASSCV